MPDLLKDGAVWLESMRTKFASTKRLYKRLGTPTLTTTIPMTPGKSEADVTESDGVTVQATSIDFLILAADLILGGVAVTPKAGDQIVDLDGRVFELMNFAGEGPWRWSDSFHQAYRVHTKLVRGS